MFALVPERVCSRRRFHSAISLPAFSCPETITQPSYPNLAGVLPMSSHQYHSITLNPSFVFILLHTLLSRQKSQLLYIQEIANSLRKTPRWGMPRRIFNFQPSTFNLFKYNPRTPLRGINERRPTAPGNPR